MTLIQATTVFILCLTFVPYVRSDCNDGWSSCDSSIWVSPKLADEQPLDSYTPGEIRGPLEYEIKFSCRGRRAGYYADLDHGCKVWHYCNTTRELNPINGLSTWTYMHFSYACLEENTRYDQVLKVCIPESRALVGCRESELYYPTGEYVHDVPITVQANNRLVPVRCPQSPPVRCQVQKDHIKLSSCSEPPGAVLKFYSDVPTSDLPANAPELNYGPRDGLTSINSGSEDDVLEGEKALTTDSPLSDSSPHSPPSPSKVTFYHHAIAGVSAKGGVKSKDGTKTFRFRETPAAAARKTSQSKTQPPTKTAPSAPTPVALRFVVFEAPKPVRRLVVTDLNPRLEQSKTSQTTYARKTSTFVARKTISAPVAGQVKTQYFSHEVRDQRTYPFIASNQFIFPRRLTDPLQIQTIPNERESTEAPATNSSASSESSESDFLGLPLGSTKILGEKIDTSFDCTGRTYGYYADVKNQCKVYHVCSPKVDEFGTKFYEHYSFVCSEGLIFDQRKLTCLPESQTSTPCGDSEKYFEKTATIFREGNESWLKNKNKVAPTEGSVETAEATSSAPVVAEPAYAVVSPSEPVVAFAPWKAFGKDQVSKVESVSSPARILKGKTSKTNVRAPEQQQEALSVQDEEQQESISSGRQVALNEYNAAPEQESSGKHPADNSENGQAHNPSITQTIVRNGGQRFMHNPRISQNIRQPAYGQSVSHSPSVNQYIAQPDQPSSSQSISHSPSITQIISQPASPSDNKVISHNPSISQYIPSPVPVGAGEQSISHNPSITQYVAAAGAAPVIASTDTISHNPSISQYVAQPAVAGFRSQTISHNPSIHQVISLPEYSRPSGRRS